MTAGSGPKIPTRCVLHPSVCCQWQGSRRRGAGRAPLAGPLACVSHPPPPSLQVGWTKDYEPWYIIDRFLNPFYDRWVFYVRGEADAVE